jgi:colanic acid biosynthesis protein WcaH
MMTVSFNFLSESEFTKAVESLPLVSVDLVLLNSSGELLLGLRCNAPAKNWWFTPGARVRENEALVDTLQRVLETELNLPGLLASKAKLMGAWDHFYTDSAFSANVSTHYVNLPHFLQLESSIDLSSLPLDQHTRWRWQPPSQAAVADDVHPYAQAYAQWVVEQGAALAW